MSQFWNERYAVEKYVYGTEPNRFFKAHLDKLPPGKILFPAEGEGRNAVHAAKQGWQVTAFDASIEARKKAERLAEQNRVAIDYQTADYESVSFPEESFDCIVLIYAHIHPLKREKTHRKLASFLKPGGKLILEGFSKKQINYNTGGPRNEAMLFSEEELSSDFADFSKLSVSEADIFLNEGPFHQGTASVIRIVGKK